MMRTLFVALLGATLLACGSSDEDRFADLDPAGDPDGDGDMAVQAASGDTCLACHGNGATDHFEVGINPCETCHYDPAPGHTPDFMTQHATAAAAELPNCTQCHRETFCVDCHDGPTNPGTQYHPANFVTRHSAESWAAPMECAECHSREVFCRDCHSNQGVAQDGRQNGGEITFWCAGGSDSNTSRFVASVRPADGSCIPAV